MHISKSFNHGKGTSSYYNTISNSEDYTTIIGEGEEQNEVVFSYISQNCYVCFVFMADYINAVSKRVQYTLFGYVTKTLSK
ncbi:MAG TPA: hypothetical protein VFD60_00665 [Nitrososphaeraceae archaeon]|jgi:hypothetical protein|nr:hypothetical protein [Nitrososphaeraceae archaeon]